MTTVIVAEKSCQALDLRAPLGNGFGVILATEGHLLRLTRARLGG